MATYLGPRDLKSRVLPDGWDATELEKLRTESDISLDAIATELSGALAALNAELLGDPFYSMLYNLTTEPTVEYRVGSTNAVVRFPEYAPIDEKRGATQGHMLPFEDWGYALGWTWKYLRRARRIQIESDVAGAVQAWRDKWHKSLLTRFFKSADDSGEHKGLGPAGYSPGFAHTAGSTSVDFIPPDYNGQAFASTHEHYDATNSTAAADWEAAIEALAADIAEHGHMPPYTLVCAAEDQGTIEGLTNFRPRALPEIQYGSSQDLARVSDLYFGAVGTPDGSVLCTWSHRVPQYTMGIWKPYGVRNPRNPLMVRYSNDTPLVAVPLPDKAYRSFPLEQLLIYGEFGVGVQERTNGACHQMNTASYSDPTIT